MSYKCCCTSMKWMTQIAYVSKDARFSLSNRSHCIAICAENLTQITIKHLSEYYLSEYLNHALLQKKQPRPPKPFDANSYSGLLKKCFPSDMAIFQFYWLF